MFYRGCERAEGMEKRETEAEVAPTPRAHFCWESGPDCRFGFVTFVLTWGSLEMSREK